MSPQSFRISLFEEHLEEASFLWEQRRVLYSNPEITWKKIGEFEERLEAHIDGLVVGGELALEIAKRQAVDGDAGELFAALCVCCRNGNRDYVLAAIDQLNHEDVEKASAAADALKYELPDAWVEDFLTLLDVGNPKVAPILARAFGYRRARCGPHLLSATKRCTAAGLPDLVWALGRIAYDPAGGILLDFLKTEDLPVRAAAALALVRMGKPEAVDYCLDQAVSNTWPILPLGLAAGQRAITLLAELVEKNGCRDCFTALGLLGDPESVPLLLSGLEQPTVAAAAADALHYITGADVYETALIPDDVGQDELVESEREESKQDKPLTRGEGTPSGSMASRLSRKAEDWNRWWEAHCTRFTEGVRYRGGKPYSPSVLLELLEAENTAHQLRYFCSEEIVVRHGQDFGLEMDAPVRRQAARLAEAAAGSRPNNSRFEAGGWYFSGRRIA